MNDKITHTSASSLDEARQATGAAARDGPQAPQAAAGIEFSNPTGSSRGESRLDATPGVEGGRPRSCRPLGLSGASSTQPEVMNATRHGRACTGNVLLVDPSGAFRDVPRGAGP